MVCQSTTKKCKTWIPRKFSAVIIMVCTYTHVHYIMLTIDQSVQRMLPPITSPHQDLEESHSADYDQNIAHEMTPIGGRKRRSSASTDPSSSQHSSNLHLELQKGSSTQSTSDVIMTSSTEEEPYLDSYARHMMAGFEAMYEEMGGDNSQSEGEKESAHSFVVDPRASKMVDLSSTRELVGQVSQEERESEVAVEGVALIQERGLDVEEGELSGDSGDENVGVKRKVKYM